MSRRQKYIIYVPLVARLHDGFFMFDGLVVDLDRDGTHSILVEDPGSDDVHHYRNNIVVVRRTGRHYHTNQQWPIWEVVRGG
jgi:hypothetical protein